MTRTHKIRMGILEKQLPRIQELNQTIEINIISIIT